MHQESLNLGYNSIGFIKIENIIVIFINFRVVKEKTIDCEIQCSIEMQVRKNDDP